MKLLIDIPEEDYKHGMLGLYFGCYSMKLHETILNGTPIPDNATNGDVIRTLFESNRITRTDEVVTEEYEFDAAWWNAPYQKGGSE